MALIIQKYGGTSVGNIDRINNVASNIVQQLANGNQVVVVVSAMAGETNRLIALANSVFPCKNSRELDIIASTGEQVTITLLSLALQKLGVKAVSLCGWQIPIVTNAVFSDARIKYINSHKILEYINNDNVVIVAGFQGVTQCGEITTLGRGGSDTSAVALAVALKARECQIFTDVNGVYNADPNKVITAERIGVVDGACMLEAASLGTKVLHVRCCELGYRYKANIRVLSSFAPQDQGTLVMNEQELESYPIISIATLESQVLFSFNIMKANQLIIALYGSSAIDMLNIFSNSLSFVVHNDDFEEIELLLKDFDITNLRIIHNLTKVSLIGSGFRSNKELNQQVWQLLENLEVYASSHNEISMSILVHRWDVSNVRNLLSQLLITDLYSNSI